MKAFASFSRSARPSRAPSARARHLSTPPPDLQPLLQAYENPTAVVTSEIMAKVADEIAKAAEEIQDSEIFEEILQVIIDVQQELDAATVKTCSGGTMSDCSADADCPDGTCVSTGDVVLGQTCNGGTNNGGDCTANTDCPDGGECGGGVVVPTPNGQINVNYICPGWDEGQFDPGYEAAPDPAKNGRITLTMTLDSGGIGRVVWGTADNCLYLVPTGGENFQASYDGGVALDLGDPRVAR